MSDPGAAPAGRVPIWKQLVDDVVRMVEDGSMTGGSRLPPTRVVAAELGVNRSTVCRAYEELAALGYLESRPGSYSTIRPRAPIAPPAARRRRSLVDWGRMSAPGAAAACRAAATLPRVVSPSAGWIDFGTLSADADRCPAEGFRRAIARVLRQPGRALLDYGDPAGYVPLRETLAGRLREHGIGLSPDEILVTQGAQHALDLALRLLAAPGASVVVEAPTYALILPLLRLYGLRAVEVPLRPDGMDLDVLEAILRRRRPALVFTMPTFHNPTGITTRQAHRERLLALAEAHRVPIVEDGVAEEMKYLGRAVLPIKSIDSHGIVLYVGSFSKVVFPGARVGWIAAHRRCVERLAELSRFGNLSGHYLLQAAIDAFCRDGGYDRYLRHVRAESRRRMSAMLRGLDARCAAAGIEWTRPNGGSTLWVRVSGADAGDEQSLLAAAAEEKLAITPGSVFFASRPTELAVRLSISRAAPQEIDEGCRRLARAVARLRATHVSQPSPPPG